MNKEIGADDIWVFVEKKLKSHVPAYFKTVLKVCGYDNGLTISAIEEEDLEYIKTEVRNGNVGKVFHESKMDFLEECTKKAKDFDFVLGHKKFLLAIVNFLKKHLDENGPDSFSLNEKPSKKVLTALKNNKENKLVLQSRKKVASKNDKTAPLVQHAMKTELAFQQKSSKISQAILAEHRKVLLKSTIQSMIQLTPEMLEKNIEKIKKKISGDFLTFELDDDCYDTTAVVKCVYCTKQVTAYLRPTPTNDYLWKSSNFNRHLRFVHRPENNNSQESDDESGVETTDHAERKEKMNDVCKDQGKDNGSELKSDVERVENEKDFGKERDLQLKCGQPIEKSCIIGKDDTKSYGSQTKTLNESNEERSGKKCISQEERKLLNKIPKVVKTESDLKLAKKGCKVSPIRIPILKNGYKSRHGLDCIITTHTCALDTIINCFASIYLESSNVREQFDDRGSKIFELIKSMFKTAGKTTSQASSHVTSSSDFKEIYTIRNTMLKELYVGWCKSGNFMIQQDTTFIDCTAGIGGLFARVCMKVDNNLASGIEEKKCNKCKSVHTKLLPFLKTTEMIRNLTNINDYLDRSPAERLCITCKNKCEITITLNNIVVLETEPPKFNRNKKIALGNITHVLHIDNTQYLLPAVMHFDAKLNHFVAYTRQNDNSWICLDDLKKTEQKADRSTETIPFILCYVATSRCIDFEKSIKDLKLVRPAMNPSNNLSQTMSEPREPQDLSETTTRPASPASKIEQQTDKANLVSKKRKKHNKNRNSSKNRKKNKFQSDSKPPA